MELQPGTDFDDAEALTCPDGYVMKRGDTNDHDPAVHPRQYEVGSNEVDDNGDGRIDEPTVIASGGYGETGLSIRFRINSALALWYATNPEYHLRAKVQHQKLIDTSVTLASGLLSITDRSYHGDYAIGLVRLAGLEDGTVYRRASSSTPVASRAWTTLSAPTGASTAIAVPGRRTARISAPSRARGGARTTTAM